MECPSCGYQPSFSLVQCPQCHQSFTASLLEEREHLYFLEERLEAWWKAKRLADGEYRELLLEVDGRLAQVLAALGAPAGARVTPATPPVAAQAPTPATGAAAPAPVPIPPHPTPAPVAATPFEPTPQRGPALPSPPPFPEPVPEPFRLPSIKWGEVWLALLSERAVRAYYLAAALMLTAVGFLLVGVYWSRPLIPFLVLLGMTPVPYVAGVMARQRAGYRIAGVALVSLGNVLAPLAVFSLIRVIDRSAGADLIWLAVSAAAVPVYGATARFVRDEVSPYLFLAAIGSVVLAGASLDSLGVAREWRLAPLAALGLPYLAAWRWLPATDSTPAIRRAFLWTAHAAVGIAAFLALASLADSEASRTGVSATMWVAAAFYAFNHALRRRWQSEYPALAAPPVALFITLWTSGVDPAWYGLGLALLAPVYVLYGRATSRPQGGPGTVWDGLTRTPWMAAAGLAVALALAWPFQDGWSRVATLWAVGATLGGAAWMLKSVWLEYAALAVLSAGANFTMAAAGAPFEWRGLAFASLAGLLMLHGRFARPRILGPRAGDAAGQADRAWRRAVGAFSGYQASSGPAPRAVTAPPYLVGYALVAVALAWPHPTEGSRIATLYTASAIFAFSAWLFRAEAWSFLAAAGALAAVWLTTAQHAMTPHAQDLVLAGLAAGYLLGGELLARRQRAAPGLKGPASASAARPLLISGYALTALIVVRTSLGLASAQHEGLAALAYLSVAALYVVSAALRRAPVFSHLAAWLSLAPFGLASAHGFYVGLHFSTADHALNLAVLAMAYLALGALLDRVARSHGGAAHAVSHGVAAVALVWYLEAILNAGSVDSHLRSLGLEVLGVAIAFYAVSAAMAHWRRHPAFEGLVARLFPSEQHPARRHAPSVFLYPAVWLGMGLAMLLASYLDLRQEQYGFALAILAPLLVAAGLGLRRARPGYAYSFYSAGYFASAVGPLVAAGDPALEAAALALSGGLYAASAVVFRKPAFAWLTAVVVAAAGGNLLAAADVPSRFLPLWSFALVPPYLALGVGLGRGWRPRLDPGERPSPFGLPFLVVGYLVSVLALAQGAAHERNIAMAAYGMGGATYGISALLLRQPLFLFGAASAFVVPYYLGLAYIPIPSPFWGLALMPGVAAYMLLGLKLSGAGWLPWRRRAWRLRLDSPATPFLALAVLGTVAVPAVWPGDKVALAASLGAIALLYAYAALVLRVTPLLYASMLAAHLGVIAGAAALGMDVASPEIAYLLVPAAFLSAGCGLLAGGVAHRRLPQVSLGSWSLPLYGFAAVDALAATVMAQTGDGPGLAAGLSVFALTAALAVLWRQKALAWVALASLGLAYLHALRLAGVLAVNSPSYSAVTALALTTATYLVEPLGRRWQARHSSWDVVGLWVSPLRWAALSLPVLSLAAMLIAIPDSGFAHSQALHLSVAFLASGAMAFERGWLDRNVWMAYGGVLMAVAALTTLLATLGVQQPQAYVLPWGLLAIGVGVRERYWGHRATGRYLEALGVLGVLAATQVQLFIEGANPDLWGLTRWEMFGILFFESLFIVVQSTLRKVRYPFYVGFTFILLNLALAVYDRTRGADKLVLLLVLGLVLFALAVFLERRREALLRRGRELRATLERWD